MSTTPTSEKTVPGTREAKSSLRWFWITIAAAAAVFVIIAAVVWQVVDDGESTAVAEVSAEVEEEIAELAARWEAAWRDGDGDAALALFTAEGRYVGRYTKERMDGSLGEHLEGWSGEELRAGVERNRQPWSDPQIVDLLIVPRPDHYEVAFFMKATPADVFGFLGLLRVVEEDGTLKIRYAESWQSLGWFRPADDLPYQPVHGAG